MATLFLLPSTVYSPPPPSSSAQARGPNDSLNTIMEELEESGGEGSSEGHHRRGGEFLSYWKSPMSDQFPTPRGNNFMPAPHLSSEPSSAAESDFSQSSLPWTRDSISTQTTDFDDIYDVSDDEQERQRKSTLLVSTIKRMSHVTKRLSDQSVASRSSLPSLIIPPSPGRIPASHKFSSPIPPTPPAKVPMSPAIFSYLASQEVPSSSAPPSLDGSYSSEQMAAMSAPATPDMGNDENEDGHYWGGVQLQPDAMATLQLISGEDALFDQLMEQIIEVPQMSPTIEMQQSPPPLMSSIRRHESVVLPPHQQRFLNSLSRLEIPSPGGFFANLSEESRCTWRFEPIITHADIPPSSTTAEHYYKTPWTEPIERFVDVQESMSDDGCPTARPTFAQQDSDETIRAPVVEEEIIATEIVEWNDYDETYVRTLRETASQYVDRTKLWLTAQTTYIANVINPPEERDDEVALAKRHSDVLEERDNNQVSPVKKMVRFSEIVTNRPTKAVGAPRPELLRQESAYYRSFLDMVTHSRHVNAHIHRLPRFEALQTQRSSFPETHLSQLLGKYQLSVVPQSAKKRMSSNVARGDDSPILDGPDRIKADKEREALAQMIGASWSVQALKLLNGGHLLMSPIIKRLARFSYANTSARCNSIQSRIRILDLGGQASCDWSWHVAFTYSRARIYTLTTTSQRQLSNSNIKGPRNHHHMTSEQLTKLPFPDNHFDCISARNLFAVLKIEGENGSDEYEKCLQECHRILKPGGYLEFSLMDSDMLQAGPLGLAKSVEFGYALRTLGYDAFPTKSFISRLYNTGFKTVKRAWTFLPVGSPNPKPIEKRDTMGVEVRVELEAMVTGSTEAAAPVAGVVGAWAWEKWMVALGSQRGQDAGRALEGNWAVFEEGRKCGAGWRVLSGWARKDL